MLHRHAAILALLCTGLAVTTVACKPAGRSDGQSGARFGGEDGGAEEAVPVELTTLGTGPIEAILRFSANLEAENQVQVLARSSGLVQKLLVEEGDDVKAGQVLLRLEDEEQRSQVAQLENDLTKAKREYAQQEKLRAKGVTSDQNLETAKYEVDRLTLMRADAARALRYTVVRAPISGTVTQRLVQRGMHVNPQQPLFGVTDFDSLVARVFVPEKELSRLAPELPARVVAQGEEHTGTVDRIAPQVDPQSGTVKVTIAVPREVGLLPGMFVEVALVIDNSVEAILLPKRALVYDSEVAYAFKLIDGDRVARVTVKPLLENRDFVSPRDGFAVGDRVVVAGQIGLKDKALVAPAGDKVGAQTGTGGAAGGEAAKEPRAETEPKTRGEAKKKADDKAIGDDSDRSASK